MKNDIIKLIGEQANVAASCIQPDNTLEEDLGLDSLDLAELQMALEDELEEPIDDKAWLGCRTVQDVIKLAGEQLATH